MPRRCERMVVVSDVDRIRDFNDAVARADVDSAAALLHPDVVWEHNLGAGTPEEGVYRGQESVTRLLGRLVEGWAYQRPEPDDIREVDAGVYAVTGALYSKHMDADSEIVSPYRQRL